MKKFKVIILCILLAVLVLSLLGWYILSYGQYGDKSSVFVDSVKIEGNSVLIEGDTTSSALAFAGYDSRFDEENLVIKPRYAVVSSVHESGHFKINIDSNGRKIEKVLIEGRKKGDYKQVWSNND